MGGFVGRPRKYLEKGQRFLLWRGYATKLKLIYQIKFSKMLLEFFATENENKLREVNEILGFELRQISVSLEEIQALKVEEVVHKKAEEAFKKTGKVVLVEDTGLEIVKWNGLPGALIKWFLATVGPEGILKMLSQERDRRAIAKTAVGFFDGKRAYIFVGEVAGTITKGVKGKSGFGWDPIFVPVGHKKSFAQMSASEKNAVSMRRLALEKMKKKVGQDFLER